MQLKYKIIENKEEGQNWWAHICGWTLTDWLNQRGKTWKQGYLSLIYKRICKDPGSVLGVGTLKEHTLKKHNFPSQPIAPEVSIKDICIWSLIYNVSLFGSHFPEKSGSFFEATSSQVIFPMWKIGGKHSCRSWSQSLYPMHVIR